MRTFRELIPPVLLAAAWVANGCGASQPSTKPTVKEETKPVAQAKTSDCVGGEMTIEIEAAEEGEAAATLEIDRGNPIMLGRDAQRAPSNDPFDATCLRTNDGERRIPPRTKVTVPIAASQTELAKIRIGDKLLLVEATARTRLRITDNPCFFWELQSTDIDPWSELPPQATCEDVERECPPGYDRVAGPGPAEDPLCGDNDRRCVKDATVMIAGQPMSVGARSCGFEEIEIGGKKVMLAPNVASRWDVNVDGDGDVGGTFVGR